MVSVSSSFTFGNMPFVYEYENDDSMDVAEIFIHGESKEAKSALECDAFHDAIYEFVKKRMTALNQ